MILSKIVLFLLVMTTNTSNGSKCTDSYQCEDGVCCCDAVGQLVEANHSPKEPFGNVSSDGNISTSGTCSGGLGTVGEFCAYSCGCAQGLECYRPLRDFCCLPMRCYDAAYVKLQREYWNNCSSNPGCASLP